MRKITALFLTTVLMCCFAFPVYASEISRDLPVWDYIEEIPVEFYEKTEPASAAAIVNSDSFVDKTAIFSWLARA